MKPLRLSLNVLMVLPESLESNNGYHARGVAHALARPGVDCVFAVPDDRVTNLVTADCRWYPYAAFMDSPPAFHNGHGPAIIHAWTPRELVREFCLKMARLYPESKIVVHLEDNEQYLTEVAIDKSWQTLTTLSVVELDRLVPPNCYHPIHGPALLARADGLTMVIDTLGRFNESRVPSIQLPPLIDEQLFYPRPRNTSLRVRLRIPDDHVVLVYSGCVHPANEMEVSSLYRAVEELNQHGCPTTLIRTGHGPPTFDPDLWPTKHVKNLGWVKRTRLPDIYAAADYFVQPGQPSSFNDFRLPSKLPEFFAMGRPVILPKTNLGLVLEHGRDGYVLDRADTAGITEAIYRLSNEPLLSRRLALGAVAFRHRYWNVSRVAETLLEFYAAVLSGHARFPAACGANLKK